jgi:hypothetical protein
MGTKKIKIAPAEKAGENYVADKDNITIPQENSDQVQDNTESPQQEDNMQKTTSSLSELDGEQAAIQRQMYLWKQEHGIASSSSIIIGKETDNNNNTTTNITETTNEKQEEKEEEKEEQEEEQQDEEQNVILSNNNPLLLKTPLKYKHSSNSSTRVMYSPWKNLNYVYISMVF